MFLLHNSVIIKDAIHCLKAVAVSYTCSILRPCSLCIDPTMVRLLLRGLFLLLLMNSVECQGVGIRLKLNLSLDAKIRAGGACVSGEMKVKERTKGVARVAELSVGDIIFGITGPDRTPAWCKVLALFPAVRGMNRTTHDGFTADHMVINHTVHPYGKKGEMRVGPVYTLATDCDASVNVAGQAFTPISTAFCPHELTWSEYIALISAIRRFANRTGYFWFDSSVYHDNDTAMVPHWLDQLHQICHGLLLCSRHDRCQALENVMADFVHGHLNREYVEIVERVFPNMGGDVSKHQAGTITEVVRLRESSQIMLFSVAGGAMVTLLIVAVAILLYRTRVKAEKELEPRKVPEETA